MCVCVYVCVFVCVCSLIPALYYSLKSEGHTFVSDDPVRFTELLNTVFVLKKW